MERSGFGEFYAARKDVVFRATLAAGGTGHVFAGTISEVIAYTPSGPVSQAADISPSPAAGG